MLVCYAGVQGCCEWWHAQLTMVWQVWVGAPADDRALLRPGGSGMNFALHGSGSGATAGDGSGRASTRCRGAQHDSDEVGRQLLNLWSVVCHPSGLCAACMLLCVSSGISFASLLSHCCLPSSSVTHILCRHHCMPTFHSCGFHTPLPCKLQMACSRCAASRDYHPAAAAWDSAGSSLAWLAL
jgi:hypothetical protein